MRTGIPGRALGTALALAALGLTPLSGKDCARRSRVPSEGPAATLLFPYFEVDLDGARTTLLAIVNKVNVGDGRSPLARTLTRVTLWTDWGIPTVSFDLYLGPGDVQTINLRDLFATGDAPVTRAPAGLFTACGSSLGGHVISASLLRDRHTGRSSLGRCYSSPRSDTTLATGYVTVDVSQRCTISSTFNHPSTPGYFSGPNRVASNENRLWGDFMLVDPEQNFASGQAAVPIVADPEAFDPGNYTFYGRYVNFDASDERRPLGLHWGSRYVTGGAFDGGTDLIVWRDNRSREVSSRICGTSPGWFPLGEHVGVTFYDEDAHSHDTGRVGDPTFFFDLVTQRVSVSSVLDPPFDFGWLNLFFIHASGRRGQSWVGWIASAEERFSAGLSATEFSGCMADPG